MALTVYNSLTRQKELFMPLHEGFVTMYVCGPTVYDHAHIGHAKAYVSFDVVARYLRYLGYKVRYVQNITDVGHLTDDADEERTRSPAGPPCNGLSRWSWWRHTCAATLRTWMPCG